MKRPTKSTIINKILLLYLLLVVWYAYGLLLRLLLYLTYCLRLMYSRRSGWGVHKSRLYVRCLFVCPRSINTKHGTYSIAVARHALTHRSKGQKLRSHGYENRHGRTFASDACCYGRVLLLPAWVCMSIRQLRLSMFSSYFRFFGDRSHHWYVYHGGRPWHAEV